MGQIVYRICHNCGKGHNPQIEPCACGGRRVRFHAISDAEAAAVAIHPKTGEVVYCFADPQQPIPESYAKEGFVKHQFKSARELESFCRKRGIVNDIEYGNKHEGAIEESWKQRREAQEEKREKMREYQRAREEVAKQMERERKRR